MLSSGCRGAKPLIISASISVGFEALTAVEVHRRFGGTYCLHLPGVSVNQASNQPTRKAETAEALLRVTSHKLVS
jgi:hypothetical protein